jgi:hypothetical protein
MRTGYTSAVLEAEREKKRNGWIAANNNNNNSKKRAAAEVIDLTHTTNSIEDENGGAAPAGRQAKRMKMPLAVGNANSTTSTTTTTTTTDGGRKKVKRAERVERQEKLAQESATWRSKYKKAFPSFVFYFDSIDESTKAQLGTQVKKLGSVGYLSSYIFPVLCPELISPSSTTSSRSINSSARKSLTSSLPARFLLSRAKRTSTLPHFRRSRMAVNSNLLLARRRSKTLGVQNRIRFLMAKSLDRA